MKLDSIVYDYGTFQTAIADALNNESPTFKAIYPSDTATSLTNVLASYGAMLQYQLVSAMANMYTDSAYSEAGIYQLAETLGNRLHGNISSELYCNIIRKNLKGINISIPAGTKFTVEDLNFFNPETIIFPLTTDTLYRVKLVQGIKLISEQVASGISGEKIYFCDDFKCNTNMVDVYVNGELWDITDSFLPYVVTDTSVSNRAQAVILKTDSDGRTYIKFGNNTNGRIPEKGSTIRIEYVSNEGANGNLNNNNLEINLSTPIYYTNSSNTRERLDVQIDAVSTASGGFNTQSIDVLRQSSPYVFGSGQRAVRRNDYKSMLLNKCGYLTCNVWGEYEEAEIQGGYDKIMMNMVYYTGIKSIQKYDLQPITTLELDIADIASTTYALTVDSTDYAGYYLKKLPEDMEEWDPETDLPLGPDAVAQNYTDEDVITFQTRADAEAYRTKYSLTGNAVFKEDPETEESEECGISVTWLDNPADPKRESQATYNISGNIEGARGFLGSYIIDVSSYDIDNNVISVKYRDKQGTGILTCDPSINSTLTDFENTVFPVNDLITDTRYDSEQEEDVFNFTLTSNQRFNEGETQDLRTYLIEDYGATHSDYKGYKSSGKDVRTGQPFVITFDNPYQLRFTFDQKTEVGAFAFKAPSDSALYKYFMHQFAIYGTNTVVDTVSNEPDWTNIKNNSAWVKLSGMQTFDAEIALDSYSDWITTNIYNPETSKIEEDDVTSTREEDAEHHITYHTQYTGGEYSYTVKVNGLTVPITDYVIDSTTGILQFTNPEAIPSESASVLVVATSYNWTKYKFYVVEIYSIHDTTSRSPQNVALKQIKALYKDSLSTIDYNNNNAIDLNVPLRVKQDTETKVICLPESMEYYEYTVTLNGINTGNGYRTGDILKWSNVVDNIVYTFTINVLSLGQNPTYKIELQTSLNGVASTNLRGKSNLMITGDTLDASSSMTRGTGGTITITSESTVNVYGSYTGNFYTNSDIQSADLPVLNKYNHFTTYVEFKQPLIKNVTIEANVEYENVTNYQVVRNNVIAAVNALFDLQPYSIGSPLNVSDVWKAINSVEGVKRFTVISPLNDINTLPYELLMLPAENLIINDIINSEYK